MKKFLCFFVLCLGVLLGAALALSGPGARIAREDHLWLMQTLLPGSETFTLEPYAGDDPVIRRVHSSDEGYVIDTVTRGYAGDISVTVAVTDKGYVTGLAVTQAHETLGLGSRILTDHRFLSQFLNGNGSFAVAGADAFSGATGEAQTGDETQVDAISGATVSSKAVIRCVNAAIAYVTGADVSSGATSWGG